MLSVNTVWMTLVLRAGMNINFLSIQDKNIQMKESLCYYKLLRLFIKLVFYEYLVDIIIFK